FCTAICRCGDPCYDCLGVVLAATGLNRRSQFLESLAITCYGERRAAGRRRFWPSADHGNTKSLQRRPSIFSKRCVNINVYARQLPESKDHKRFKQLGGILLQSAKA